MTVLNGFRYQDHNGKKVFVIADSFQVGTNGELLFFTRGQHGDQLIRAVAPGMWQDVYEDFE